MKGNFGFGYYTLEEDYSSSSSWID